MILDVVSIALPVSKVVAEVLVLRDGVRWRLETILHDYFDRNMIIFTVPRAERCVRFVRLGKRMIMSGVVCCEMGRVGFFNWL